MGDAFKALGQVAEMGDRRALTALTNSLKDWHAAVRACAADALAHVSRTVDLDAVNSRKVAVEALKPFATTKGHSLSQGKKAVAVLRGCLSDAAPAVREAAMQALAHIVEEGDSCKDDVVKAKVAALESLGDIARSGHQPTMDVL